MTPEQILNEAISKLETLIVKMETVFKAGYDAGFIGSETNALIENVKTELKAYIDAEIAKLK